MAPESSNPIEVVSVSRKQRRGEIGSGIEHVSRRAAVQPVRDLGSAGDDSMPNCTGCNQSSPVIQLFADELSYEGGPLASGAAIQLIFWGSAWNDPATSPRPGEIIAAVQTLVDSTYFFPLTSLSIISWDSSSTTTEAAAAERTIQEECLPIVAGPFRGRRVKFW